MRSAITSAVRNALNTRAGYRAVQAIIRATQYRVFAARTVLLMQFDAVRLKARLGAGAGGMEPTAPRLHFGCGSIKIQGWLNVDVANSDFDVDLASGHLPWRDGSFEAIVGEHIVEHLELETELIPLLKEFRRLAKPGAEIWVSCPDMAKVCGGYLEDKGLGLLGHIKNQRPRLRFPDDCPPQHIINLLFHQYGEHKNLYDFELLSWALTKAGFTGCQRRAECDLLARFPEIPPRHDDGHSLYVSANLG